MSYHARIAAIEYHLPEQALRTEDLARECPEWGIEELDRKTGIGKRHIAAADECASDLAVRAAEKLFASGVIRRQSVDYVLLCTQTPDYFLPATACLLQDRLGLPTCAGAVDINQGCSGFIYALGLAEGLIASGQASNILLVTADTYTKFIHAKDRSVRPLFGDAAAATLIEAVETPRLGPFLYGTDGSGAQHLIVPQGGMRSRETGSPEQRDERGNVRSAANLYMNGGQVFGFTLQRVPQAVEELLRRARLARDDLDLVVFHQANRHMLEELRKASGLPAERFYYALNHCGNTVSSSIPIALWHAAAEGRLFAGAKVLLAGFGVGYSWSGTILRC